MLKLNEQIYNAIRRHGEETYPHECCGVLLGRSARWRERGRGRRARRQHPHRFGPQPLPHRPAGARKDPAPGPRALGSTSSASTTRIPTTRRSGRGQISPKPTGSAAPTSSHPSKRVWRRRQIRFCSRERAKRTRHLRTSRWKSASSKPSDVDRNSLSLNGFGRSQLRAAPIFPQRFRH